MPRWNKQIPVNAIVGRASDLTDDHSLLRRDKNFLKESGMTWAQVAEKFGVSVGTVRDRYNWYKENKINGG